MAALGMVLETKVKRILPSERRVPPEVPEPLIPLRVDLSGGSESYDCSRDLGTVEAPSFTGTASGRG